jgi:hypothetical protein
MNTSKGAFISGTAALIYPNKTETLSVFKNFRTNRDPSGSPAL